MVGREQLTDLIGHTQGMVGQLLNVERPQDAGYSDEKRIFGEMDSLTKPSPKAVMEVVTSHVACGEGRGKSVGVVVEEAGGVEGIGIVVAVLVSIQAYEIGHDNGAFRNKMGTIRNVFCDAVRYACGLELSLRL